MILVEQALLRIPDRRALLEQAQGKESFQKAQLVLIHADRIESADIQRADLDVFHTGPEQGFRGPLARACHALRADEAVVLVFDLQDVGVELAILAIDLHAKRLVGRVRRRDRVRQVAHILLEAVDRHGQARLVAVAVSNIAHPQARRVGLVRGVVREVRQLEVPAPDERLAHHWRDPEQVQHDPAVAPVVTQQVEIARRYEACAALTRFPQFGICLPERQRERVVEMHTRDGLHHPPVTQSQAVAVNGLHPPDMGAAVLRERDVRVALDRGGHARGPQQLIAQVAVDELVQVQQVLQQLPGRREGGRDELDQGLGIVGRDVLVGERRAERQWVRRFCKAPVGRHPQRLLLHALAPTLQDLGLAAVHECGQALLEGAVYCGCAHPFSICCIPGASIVLPAPWS